MQTRIDLGPCCAAALGVARPARAAAGDVRRLLVFYYPDGVPGPSQDGQPSAWHPTGRGRDYQLPDVLSPLAPWREQLVFFRGLSMGATDAGSHPGGAVKLLTAVDHGQGASIDQVLARTVGAGAPHRHLYLGVQANQNGATGDKHISYPSAGRSVPPEDDPRRAFGRLFGGGPGAGPDQPGDEAGARRRSILDIHRAELETLRARFGGTERARLELHLEALREVEQRVAAPRPSHECSPEAPAAGDLYAPERFPALLRAQTDVMVQAMACGLTRVGVLQASHHTSELVMSRFAGTEMYDPNHDMRSHQASHYGPRHDMGHLEYRAYVQQRRWFAARFADVLHALSARPEGDGTMLDHTLVLLCTEVCDGNTHLHDDMPLVIAGGGAGGRRHRPPARRGVPPPRRPLRLDRARDGRALRRVRAAERRPVARPRPLSDTSATRRGERSDGTPGLARARWGRRRGRRASEQ